MDSRSAGNLLKEKFPQAVAGIEEFRGETTVTVEAPNLFEVMTFLRENTELAYDMLIDQAGVDFPSQSPRFTIAYLLHSMKFNNRLRIKTKVAAGVAVDSVSAIWKAANWMERETAEMFGITFKNHPNPQHILLPDDFVGYPLRKDYDVKGPNFDQPFQVCLDE
ncbi:MAG: NADH-quinone oxidoreductase subunit C [Syntrophales bacterium]